MFEQQASPILNPVFADYGRTPPSTSTEPPVRPSPKKSVNPQIGKIISELGFRFRPAAQADLAAHAERLRLLTSDLADVPPSLLEQAARKWSAEQKFMPTAAEMISLAKQFATKASSAYRMPGETLAQRANYRILFETPPGDGGGDNRPNCHWVGEGAGHLEAGLPTREDCFPDRVFEGRWQS